MVWGISVNSPCCVILSDEVAAATEESKDLYAGRKLCGSIGVLRLRFVRLAAEPPLRMTAQKLT